MSLARLRLCEQHPHVVAEGNHRRIWGRLTIRVETGHSQNGAGPGWRPRMEIFADIGPRVIVAKARADVHFLLAPARLGAILCGCAVVSRAFRAKPCRA